MAIFAKGADPEALEASATKLAGYARTCDEVRESIGTSAAVIRANWQGADLQTLAGRVPAVQQQLSTISHTLTGLGERLTANARAQRVTSGTYAGAGGSAPVPVGDGRGNPRLAADLAVVTGSSVYVTAKLAKNLLGVPQKFAKAVALREQLRSVRGYSWADGAEFARKGGAEGEKEVLKGVKGLVRSFREPGTELFRKSDIIADATKWGKLGDVVPLIEDGGKLARTLGVAGKALGPLGAVFSGVNAVSDFAQGNYGRGAYDTVMAAAGIAACIPPLTVAGGLIAGGMAVGELVYDHWDDITRFTGHAADAVGHVATKVADSVGHAASSVIHHLNPFSW